jgi:hypothetical protein
MREIETDHIPRPAGLVRWSCWLVLLVPGWSLALAAGESCAEFLAAACWSAEFARVHGEDDFRALLVGVEVG